MGKLLQVCFCTRLDALAGSEMRHGVGCSRSGILQQVLGSRGVQTGSSEHVDRLMGLLGNCTFDADTLHIENPNEQVGENDRLFCLK
jgi:hypothetical protein